MYIVGLTGGIGSGKTAVSDRFQQKGITIVDADLCSRIVVEPGTPALEAIQEHFGNNILDEHGQLDRAALRSLVFSLPEEKKWLENLLHPLIAEETFRQLAAATSDYVILVSPLLIESQQNLICDRILLVDVPEELQIKRTAARDNNDRAQVERIMQSQAPRAARLAKADDVIENTQGLNHLDESVEKLHCQYLHLAQQKNAREHADAL